VPALALSFVILHELTAVVPFGGAFYAARALGLGEQLVESIQDDEMRPAWARDTARRWVDEGGAFVARVGTRYGIWGYEKRAPGERAPPEADAHLRAQAGSKIVGDVANAVVAYTVVKVRICALFVLSQCAPPAHIQSG
jgi:hypothetical protein